jgi:HlyD family secretion protein
VPLQSVTVRDKQTVAKALGREIQQPLPVAQNINTENKDLKLTREERENLQRIVWVAGRCGEAARGETGISDTRYMQILEGVNAGESVVSGSYNAIARELEHDKQVKVQEPGAPGSKDR